MAHQINGAQLATLLQHWDNPIIRALLGSSALSGALVWFHKDLPPMFGNRIAEHAATHPPSSSTSQSISSQDSPSPNVPPAEILGLLAGEPVRVAGITVQTTVSDLPKILDNMASATIQPLEFSADGSSASPLSFTLPDEQRLTVGGPGPLKIGGTICGVLGLVAVAYAYLRKKRSQKTPTPTEAEMIAYLFFQLNKMTQEKSDLLSELDTAKKHAVDADFELAESIDREEESARQVWSMMSSKKQLEKQVQQLASNASRLNLQITEPDPVSSGQQRPIARVGPIEDEHTRCHQAEQEEKGKQITELIHQLKNAKKDSEESRRMNKAQEEQLNALSAVKLHLESKLAYVSANAASMRDESDDQDHEPTTTETAGSSKSAESAPKNVHFSSRRKMRGHLAEHVKTRNLRREPYPDDILIELRLPCFNAWYEGIPIPKPVSVQEPEQALSSSSSPRSDGGGGAKDAPAPVECTGCHQWYTKSDLCDHLPVCRLFFTYAVYCTRLKKAFVNNRAWKEVHKDVCGASGCQAGVQRQMGSVSQSGSPPAGANAFTHAYSHAQSPRMPGMQAPRGRLW